jgi:hypothetical protein
MEMGMLDIVFNSAELGIKFATYVTPTPVPATAARLLSSSGWAEDLKYR